MWESTSNKCYAILLYGDLEEYEDEIAKLTAIIAQEPGNVFAWHNRGLAHFEIGEFRNARRDLRTATTLHHKEYMPYYVLAELYEKEEDFGAAEEAYKDGLKILPDNADLNLKRAQLYAKQQRYAHALKHIDAAIENGSGYIYIHDERAAIVSALESD